MVRSFDPSGDWAVLDNTETVTLYRRQADGALDSGEQVAHVLRRAVRQYDQDSGGILAQNEEVVWHLYADNIAGADPKVADVVEDSSNVRWTITLVEVQTVASRYRCTTTREI